ncbi:MAG TPA: hypothetical protein VEI01_03440 [Terriglobales bacterium]|nr:hypothetical protein [Terriglobales bacterium]
MGRSDSGVLWCVSALLLAVPLLGEDSVPAAPNTIPEGTRFLIQLNDKLDTRHLEPGKHFKAKLAEDLVALDGTTIPRGKTIKGHVSAIEPGFHTRLLLSFDQIDTGRGSRPLIATVTGAPGEHGVKSPDGEEGELESKGMSKQRTLEAAAVGAGVGAVVGGAGGSGKAAGVGAASGAAMGAAVGLLSDHDLRLEKGTVLEIRLDHPLQVPAR